MNRPRILTEEQFAAHQARVRGNARGSSQGHGIRVTNHSVGDLKKSSPYKSKWEAAYASKLELDKSAGLILRYYYEPFSLWLPGKVRYKPDFLVETNNVNPWGGHVYPNIEIIEVKGWSKNRRDGMTRLKMAAALFPCFLWRLVYRTKGGGWDGEYL